MTISYWGVDHGEEIFKANTKSSEDRKALVAGLSAVSPLGAGIHGAVAGKKNKKARAFGNQAGGSFVGSMGGGALGALAGAATRNPTASAVGGVGGSLVGGAAGGLAGLSRNERKGYLNRG